MDSIPLKRCSKCGELKPATSEFFSRATKHKDGLQYHCKACNHKYHLDNIDRIKNRKRDYRSRNHDTITKNKKLYYQQNREKHAIKGRAWRLLHREELIDYNRNYQRENSKRLADYARNYNRQHPELVKARAQRRRARKCLLPATFTIQHWYLCLEYWHYCCAVCGAQLRDLFGDVEPHADHWIPITYKGADNPGSVPENMICLCDSCNQSKNNKNADVWLDERFGKHKAKKILMRITEYFNWILKQ